MTEQQKYILKFMNTLRLINSLKPCPVCGGEAVSILGYRLYLDADGHLTDNPQEKILWYGACVECHKCGMVIEKKGIVGRRKGGKWFDQIKIDAVEAWNRRAKDAE